MQPIVEQVDIEILADEEENKVIEDLFDRWCQNQGLKRCRHQIWPEECLNHTTFQKIAEGREAEDYLKNCP